MDAIDAAFAPYVKDRGLDWETTIEEVDTAKKSCIYNYMPAFVVSGHNASRKALQD